MTPIRGRTWLFGDDLNTDVIHPPQFFSLDEEKVKRGLFHGLDPDIQPNLRPGDVLIGGRNFGCGSSRETSVRSLKLNGIGAIVAVDFARIFFRNCTNNGVPCLTLAQPDQRDLLRAGRTVEIDPTAGRLTTDAGEHVSLDPPGEFVQRVWQVGGLLALLPGARTAGRS
ncbi:hypothetical protein ACIQWB_19505 [Streptomyces olivaceus]|uniref:LeuD/DmdB family oxidoreductase small subunit n=1 Tax=Streptomyces olivaceus TaxID=47716 RepID=UPI003802DB95